MVYCKVRNLHKLVKLNNLVYPSQVVTASSVNSFKSRLDNYWHQIGYGFSQA